MTLAAVVHVDNLNEESSWNIYDSVKLYFEETFSVATTICLNSLLVDKQLHQEWASHPQKQRGSPAR